MFRRLLIYSCVFVFLVSFASFAAETPAPKTVEITAADGAKLKATYFAAGRSGPGLMLFHQCNRDRKMWNDLAPRLASLGINVLALDFRGFGESGGPRANEVTPQEGQRIVTELWPGDVDKAFEFLSAQTGVERDVIGAAGASCGVNQSIQLARRHPEVKSLVLLSGTTDAAGRQFLKQSKNLPLFGSAADDDPGAVDLMQWLLSISPNPANQFQHYQAGGHGIEMFAPHTELTSLIVNWFDATLIKTPGRAPENKNASFRGASILAVIDSPGGAAKAKAKLAQARERDPKAIVFPEAAVNLMGYEHLQAGDVKGAIEIFELNVFGYPESPNTYDSLSDAFATDGQLEKAIDNAKKAIRKLATDTTDPEDRKKLIRESAEAKLKQLGGVGQD